MEILRRVNSAPRLEEVTLYGIVEGMKIPVRVDCLTVELADDAGLHGWATRRFIHPAEIAEARALYVEGAIIRTVDTLEQAAPAAPEPVHAALADDAPVAAAELEAPPAPHPVAPAAHVDEVDQGA